VVLTELIILAERNRNVSSATVGGGILNNIPRKNNVLPTAKPGLSPFPRGTAGHNEILGYEGAKYPDDVTLRQMSDYIVTDTPPLGSQFNNATLPQVPPLQSTGPGKVVPLNTFTRIHPSETAVLHTSGRIVPVNKRVMGPSPQADTPFHPKKRQPAPVHRTRPHPASLKAFHTGISGSGSFAPTGTVTGTLSSHSHADIGKDRWSTVKKGAAG
jgi:hypothetical protein